MYENIKFPKSNFVVADGYFYYVDETSSILYQKSSNGDTVFTYPFTTTLNNIPILSMVYDGYFFWTLQVGATSLDMVVKKWIISNFSVVLVATKNLTHTDEHYYSSTSFAVEYYTTSLSEALFGSTTLYCGDSDVFLESFSEEVKYGTEITIGPNEEGYYDTVTVTGVSGDNSVGLSFFPEHDYSEGTPVYFAKNIILLNKYKYTQSIGSLYKINVNDLSDITVISETDFTLATAICYYYSSKETFLIYTVNTLIKFLDLSSYEVKESMTIDNVQSDQTTVSKIFALQSDGSSIFRLQKVLNYYGGTETIPTYNYQITPIRPFIDSVSIDAFPRVLPSNGINISEISVVVQDQYGHPKKSSEVIVKDSDPVGYVTVENVYTNVNGVAITFYRAGTSVNNVLIMAAATQYD